MHWLRDEYWKLIQSVSYSRFKYSLPVVLPEYKFFPRSPEHKGRYINAIDIAIPDPTNIQTIIYAPQSGIVKAGILSNNKWGSSPENKIYLNWINVEIDNYEFFEIAHVASLPDKILRVGTYVQMGEPILMAALNGRITKTNNQPDCHVHFMVGRWININETSFVSLKIRWEDDIFQWRS